MDALLLRRGSWRSGHHSVFSGSALFSLPVPVSSMPTRDFLLDDRKSTGQHQDPSSSHDR
jgi:hypothetical protein